MKFTPNPVDTLPAPEIPEDPIAPGEDPRKLCIKLGGAITRYWDTVWEDQKIQAAAEAERLCRTMGRDGRGRGVETEAQAVDHRPVAGRATWHCPQQRGESNEHERQPGRDPSRFEGGERRSKEAEVRIVGRYKIESLQGLRGRVYQETEQAVMDRAKAAVARVMEQDPAFSLLVIQPKIFVRGG